MMSSYTLDPKQSLREVYLTYLIAINNKQFLEENNLIPEQVIAFRTINHLTWGDFIAAKSQSTKQER